MAKPHSLADRLRGFFSPRETEAAADAARDGGDAVSGASSPAPTEAAVRDALRTVLDPEVGIDIVELGLVYRVATTPGTVRVDMTMTTPACPSGPQLRDQAAQALRAALSGAPSIEVRLVWDPPWNPAMMSPAAKRRLGW